MKKNKIRLIKVMLFILFISAIQTANAVEQFEINSSDDFKFNIDLPDNFPKENPTPSGYVARSTTQVFFKKWAESIKNDNKKVEVKLSDKKYTGVGLKQWDVEAFEYFPQILIENNKNPIECTLYTGMVSTYADYKSPMLYDSQNKICVAIIGKRKYYQSENPYFLEPLSFKDIVYVGAPLKAQISLQEISLVPEGATEKEAQKYLKEINKLYSKVTNDEYSQITKAAAMAQSAISQY